MHRPGPSTCADLCQLRLFWPATKSQGVDFEPFWPAPAFSRCWLTTPLRQAITNPPTPDSQRKDPLPRVDSTDAEICFQNQAKNWPILSKVLGCSHPRPTHFRPDQAKKRAQNMHPFASFCSVLPKLRKTSKTGQKQAKIVRLMLFAVFRANFQKN